MVKVNVRSACCVDYSVKCWHHLFCTSLVNSFFKYSSGSSELKERVKGNMMKWYVLAFTPTRFKSVFSFLDYLNVSWFCPMETVDYRRPDKVIGYRKKDRPLFPGYLFIKTDFECVHPTNVTAHQYIMRFISFGAEPVPVPDKMIMELMELKNVSEVSRGVRSIDHDFAAILLMDEPQKRSIALLNYIAEKFQCCTS